MFRTVWMDLACASCGMARRIGVQFKTGCDALQDYELGQRVVEDFDEVEHVGLRTHDRYRGIAERYCRACRARWAGDAVRADGAVLLEAIEAGRLTIRKHGVAVTAERVRETIEREAEQAYRTGSPQRLYELHPSGRHTEFLWGGRPVVFPSDAWQAFWDYAGEQLNQRLKRAGWSAGGDQFRDDLTVYLDEESRVRVDVGGDAGRAGSYAS